MNEKCSDQSNPEVREVLDGWSEDQKEKFLAVVDEIERETEAKKGRKDGDDSDTE